MSPKLKILFLVFYILFNSSAMLAADGNTGLPRLEDVKDVLVEGDSTLMGMRIESSYFAEGSFLIETTGARFEYIQGCLKLYQGLDAVDRRLLAEIEFDNDPNFVKVESTPDHVLFMSPSMNIGIYGDSTLILSPKKRQWFKCTGHFKPDYEGRDKGELLLIDKKGGMEIYPQRYETGYKIRRIESDKADWVADYVLDAGQRIMIAAFPGRPFDWEKSFRSNWLSTCGSMGLGQGNRYGQLPADNTIRIWAQNFHIVNIFFNGFYKKVSPYGPYEIANKAEFDRFLKTAHLYQLKVLPYSSLYYWLRRRHGDYKGFYDQIKRLQEQYVIDGIYIDGLGCDIGPYHRQESRIDNWETIRRLRQLFGRDGVIVLHDTQNGSSIGTVPNIDVYCDITLNGENVDFNALDDPYINYQVRKYGISNTIGMWKTGKHPPQITQKAIIDKTLQMNGRCRMGAFVVTQEPPPTRKPYDGKYIWPTTLNADYDYYLDRLEYVKKQYKQSLR